jgi:membrane-associated protein
VPQSLLHSLIGFVSTHAAWAYFAVFLAALLEAVPVLGSFIPGTTMIVAISALIPGGHLSVLAVLAAAISGGALGDGLSFLTGRRLQSRVLQSWPLAAYPKVVAQSEEFFRRRGVLAVLFARFVAPVRAFVPIIAGALTMPPARFFAVNIPAVILWAAAHVLASAFAGDFVERNLLGAWREELQPYLLSAVAALAFALFSVWAIKHWRLCAAAVAEKFHALHSRHAKQAASPDDQPRATDLR